MEVESTYVHALEGRLRIKVAGVKGLPEGASRVETHLRSLEGVSDVVANPMTGNVLVLYDAETTAQEAILAALRELGCLPYRIPSHDTSQRRVLLSLARSFAEVATEVALRRALVALI